MKPAIIRNIDSFGRINIPSKIRQTMHLATGDAVEIRTSGNEIVLSKYQVFEVSEPELKNYLQILYSVIQCGTAICNSERILASKGICLYEGTAISRQLSEQMQTSRIKKDSFQFPSNSIRRNRSNTICTYQCSQKCCAYRRNTLLNDRRYSFLNEG